MWVLGSLAFVHPWLLTALLALPGLYWLLRLTPPAPKRIRFPAITFLLGLPRTEETAAHTPWWLILLRLCIALMVILGLAAPYLNFADDRKADGPLLIVVDNSWAAAQNWQLRKNTLGKLVDEAVRTGRPVALVTTAPEINPSGPRLRNATDVKTSLRALAPVALNAERQNTLKQIEAIGWPKNTEIIWLSDGLDDGYARDLANSFLKLGSLTLIEDPQNVSPLALLPPAQAGQNFVFKILRADSTFKREASVQIFGKNNRLLARQNFSLAQGQNEIQVTVELPQELRNEAIRAEIGGVRSAGTQILFDERWRKKRVAIMSAQSLEQAQPLLSDLYYVERALLPYAEIEKIEDIASLNRLLDEGLSALILADIGTLSEKQTQKLSQWLEQGGVLIRFAGDHIGRNGDMFIPVALRDGGRALGGSLTWEQPQKLGSFPPTSPFFGLNIPEDVKITRQVLAQPSPELDAHTWARLADGTPLVTATLKGKGTLILFHVTAGPQWSNLPLSGLYVDMLRKAIALSQTSSDNIKTNDKPNGIALAPFEIADGFGALHPAPSKTHAVKNADFDTIYPDALHPPGLYGPPSSLRALNATYPQLILRKMSLPSQIRKQIYEGTSEIALGPIFLLIALILTLIDSCLALWLAGAFKKLSLKSYRFGFPRVASGILFLSVILSATPSQAADVNNKAGDKPITAAMLDAALETRLAYVVTGDAATDAMSRAGLVGLSAGLTARTTVEPGDPIGINIETDDLTFLPLIYWPVLSNAPPLSLEAAAKLDTYMKHGGMILFDTRDADAPFGTAFRNSDFGATGNAALARILRDIDIPRLEPVPKNHILTKSFYLLRDFPGRYASGRLWVQAGQSNATANMPAENDGVSAVIIGSNDYAAAWARDAAGRPLAAVTPGGERQRELALRVGINVVMYTLTGNYKADQVHVPSLLERLSQ